MSIYNRLKSSFHAALTRAKREQRKYRRFIARHKTILNFVGALTVGTTFIVDNFYRDRAKDSIEESTAELDSFERSRQNYDVILAARVPLAQLALADLAKIRVTVGVRASNILTIEKEESMDLKKIQSAIESKNWIEPAVALSTINSEVQATQDNRNFFDAYTDQLLLGTKIFSRFDQSIADAPTRQILIAAGVRFNEVSAKENAIIVYPYSEEENGRALWVLNLAQKFLTDPRESLIVHLSLVSYYQLLNDEMGAMHTVVDAQEDEEKWLEHVDSILNEQCDSARRKLRTAKLVSYFCYIVGGVLAFAGRLGGPDK